MLACFILWHICLCEMDNPQKLRINELGYNDQSFIELYSSMDQMMEIAGPYHIIICKRIGNQPFAKTIGIISLEGMKFHVSN